MKTILSLVATTGLLIGWAAIGYAQQGSTPSGAAQQGSTPSAAAPFGSAGPSGTIIGPDGGGGRIERRDRIHGDRGRDDVTIGRGDRGGCTTQTYVVPSEQTGDKTSVDVVRC